MISYRVLKTKPLISVVIPVKNGSATIANCLNAIKGQNIYNQTEVIIIDSGSSDGTLEILENYDVKIIPIDPKSFNHGATRNLGVKHAKGEFVVMTVQDAIAINDTWLETMLAHYKDPEVAGVCGQQIVPHDPEKNPHEWFRPQSSSTIKHVQFRDRMKFEALSPKEQHAVCGWDDVNAMYRRKVLENIPFQPLVYGEDMFWAKQALEQGHKLVFDSAARVAHYHFQYPEYTYRRTLISKLFTYKCFGYERVDTYTLKDYLLVVYRNFKWGCAPKWIFHNFKIIYQHRKATREVLEAIENDTMEKLEKELSLNVPIGIQKTA
ncbi:glycosyltransferase [Flavobacteriaceae bacterium F89]|uniref:Glycosyltransferase n=1 Tax=Cerina litoralis TaxID=2874477 RepID=A0AAE3EZK8_9FLAO|nr:glycosyltransferase family 2 protein [Cerina litoralis]MCG2462592.1 glycosyltransferase [Cerina litoralis]